MNNTSPSADGTSPLQASSLGTRAELFLVSFLVLFLELACIRWFPAHVLYLTFFTNTVLLACFLGLSAGCLAAGRRRNYLVWSPVLLLLALAAALGIETIGQSVARVVDVGNQASPQLVYFGTEYYVHDLARFVIPVEALAGFFFLGLALLMMGPGQEMGRRFSRLPGRLEAYTLNIGGSLLGIAAFAACSWLELPPFWWFLSVAVIIGYFLRPYCARRPLLVRYALLLVVAVLASVRSGPQRESDKVFGEILWSPYYRIDYYFDTREIMVNQIGHQEMVAIGDDRSPAIAYALPHVLRRDSGGKPFEDVLIIGAGSGNDVASALRWGARHVDAVEIDPAINRLGRLYHPDRPYDDPRVTIHLDDGRNFLHATDRRYDLILYALVDSLVLHSSYSNIRLESYLFTREAFADVHRLLKPGGVFITYNYFRRGWIVARLSQSVEETFGQQPMIFSLPYRQQVDEASTGGFTLLMAGETTPLRNAFAQGAYWVPLDRAPRPDSPSGFQNRPPPGGSPHWALIGPSRLAPPGDLRTASDEWPFLYLRRPMIPDLGWRGMLIMGGIAGLFLLYFTPRAPTGASVGPRFDGRMFFLGAGFLLIETKAVVQMALLFGSTWMVNSIVFFAVLLMILLANLYVLRTRPPRLWPYYFALLAALALNCVIPLSAFLGMSRALQVAGSCGLVFTPIFFAGIIFAGSFSRSQAPDRAFGANIAGAMLGGLSEYTSMLLGFRYLMLLAIAFYVLSAWLRPRAEESALVAPAVAVAES